MSLHESPALQAFEARDTLRERFGDNALLLYALEMRFALEDVDTVATAALTDGPRDRKCDAIYLDRETSTAIIAQGYYSDHPKPAAKANKASDLNTAAAWIFSLDYPLMNESLEAAARELDQAIRAGEVAEIELWYCHNLPESENVQEELDRAAATARALLNRNYPKLDIKALALEVGMARLDEWYASIQNPILVADQIDVEVDGWFEEVGADWAAICVSVPALWLTELHSKYGDRLFSANVRGYMPSRKTARNINHNIEETARSKSGRFWAYNNGVTALSHDYIAPATPGAKGTLKLQGIAIVNGAQTTGALSRSKSTSLEEAAVMARFIKTDNDEIVDEIIRYNNSQNPIKASDFRSTDRHQERLRREFASIPGALYFGARRGGAQDRARRPKELISSDTAAQCLAAFHGDPGVAYHALRSIWENDEIYAKFFSDSTTAAHIVFCYSLLLAIQEAKAELVQRSHREQLAEDERDTLAVFRQRGSQFLLVASVGSCLEIVLNRPVTTRFSLSFGANISPAEAQSRWEPVLAAILPFANCLRVEELKGSLRNRNKVEEAVGAFRSIIRSTERANRQVFAGFAASVRAS